MAQKLGYLSKGSRIVRKFVDDLNRVNHWRLNFIFGRSTQNIQRNAGDQNGKENQRNEK